LTVEVGSESLGTVTENGSTEPLTRMGHWWNKK